MDCDSQDGLFEHTTQWCSGTLYLAWSELTIGETLYSMLFIITMDAFNLLISKVGDLGLLTLFLGDIIE